MEFEALSNESEQLLENLLKFGIQRDEIEIDFSPQADELEARGFIKIENSYYDGTHCVSLTPLGMSYFDEKKASDGAKGFEKANKLAVIAGNFVGTLLSKLNG